MKINITLKASSFFILPVEHGILLQGMVYQIMDDPALRSYLHEHGFMLEKRKFKLFTFSRLMGKSVSLDRSRGGMVFTPPLQMVICSPLDYIIQEIGTGLMRQGEVRLGDKRLEVEDISVEKPQPGGSRIRVHMLSPLTVYSTLPRGEKGKFTYYYSPYEPRFKELVRNNLAKKYQLIYGYFPPDLPFNIYPVKIRERDFKITRFKGNIVKGWMGEYELYGSTDLLQVALDAGLGSKNSQGYGCCALSDG